METVKKEVSEKVIEKRRKQQENLKNLLLKRLKKEFTFEKDIKIRMNARSLEIFVMDEEKPDRKLFGSDIEFFNTRDFRDQRDNLTINFASSGSFTPKERAPMVRTKHAMECLNNWKEINELICSFMNQLERIQRTWRFEDDNLEK